MKKNKGSVSWKLLLFFSGLFGLDALLKLFVNSCVMPLGWQMPVYPFGGIGIFENLFGGISFSINHVENLGAAWGLFAGYSKYLLAVRIAVAIGLYVYIRKFLDRKALKLPLLFILTGALGNILDHVVYGHVIDMFHFTFWGYSYPVFNLADTFICIGIARVLYVSLFCKAGREICVK